MPTRSLKFLPGCYYHLYNRGFMGLKIFGNDIDCRKFLDRIDCYCGRCDVKVVAYSFLDNHFHLLVRGGDVAKFISKTQQSFAVYYNRKYRRRGQVFDSRYGAKMVGDSEYFEVVKRYILKNPSKRKMAELDDGKLVNSSGLNPD